MKVGIEPSVGRGSRNLFPIVHSALRLPLYSFLVNPSLSSLICVSFSLHTLPPPPFIFSVYPFYFLRSSINPPIHPPCASLSASVHPPSDPLSLSPPPSFSIVWNLSTSGQPHLLGCPQDINRTQRLVSVYQRPLNKRIATHSPSFRVHPRHRLVPIGGVRKTQWILLVLMVT